jgi:hypothetical protein
MNVSAFHCFQIRIFEFPCSQTVIVNMPGILTQCLATIFSFSLRQNFTFLWVKGRIKGLCKSYSYVLTLKTITWNLLWLRQLLAGRSNGSDPRSVQVGSAPYKVAQGAGLSSGISVLTYY